MFKRSKSFASVLKRPTRLNLWCALHAKMFISFASICRFYLRFQSADTIAFLILEVIRKAKVISVIQVYNNQMNINNTFNTVFVKKNFNEMGILQMQVHKFSIYWKLH